MNTMRDVDQRMNAWLEEGAQSVPDWLVEAALEQAHATPQLGRSIRIPRIGRLRRLETRRLAPALAGALGALAVLGAFVLGLLSALHIGDQQPTLTPSPTPSSAPTGLTPGPAASPQLIDILPLESPDFYALVGLAATSDAVWTVVVTDTSPGRLVRIDAVSGVARVIAIAGASGLLSPPTADGDTVWTASAAGLHRVAATGEGEPMTFALPFQPGEIAASGEGLWVAREGGTSLVDRQTGQVVREIDAPGQTVTGRIIGGPLFGSLWACSASGAVQLLDPADGALKATADLPPGGSCRGRFVNVSGVEGIDDGVIPLLANAVLHPSTGEVSMEFDVAWSDVIDAGARLQFVRMLRDPPGNLALVELDPVARGPRSTSTFAGNLHLNRSFESGHLAVGGAYLWVLAGPPSDSGEQRPQIMRVPLAVVVDN